MAMKKIWKDVIFANVKVMYFYYMIETFLFKRGYLTHSAVGLCGKGSIFLQKTS